MEKINQFIEEALWMKDLSCISLENIEQKMVQCNFEQTLIHDIISAFKKRIEQDGEEKFQIWFHRLHYRTPEEFQNEKVSIAIYEKNSDWFEKEVEKLESETKLSWQKQTEDIKSLDDKARKSQLVIRHRLSEIELDLIN